MVGIPGARNVDHVAFTVPDLDRATALFASVFDALPLYRQGPVSDPDGDAMLRQLAVHPRASCDVTMLRLGPTANLELFEYRAPDQRRSPPALCDVGGHELVFAVTNLRSAVTWARQQPALTVLDVDTRAGRCVLRTAWDMPLALVERVSRPLVSAGLPGLLGLDHAAFTVADLTVAVDFLTGPLGGRLIAESSQDATVALGPVTQVRLRPCAPGGATRRPRNSDVGGHHLAFYVTDVPDASRYLSRLPGVRLLGEPQMIAEGGPIDGVGWQYFTGPDGFQFEICSAPPSLPYEATTTARKFGPAPAWETAAT